MVDFLVYKVFILLFALFGKKTYIEAENLEKYISLFDDIVGKPALNSSVRDLQSTRKVTKTQNLFNHHTKNEISESMDVIENSKNATSLPFRFLNFDIPLTFYHRTVLQNFTASQPVSSRPAKRVYRNTQQGFFTLKGTRIVEREMQKNDRKFSSLATRKNPSSTHQRRKKNELFSYSNLELQNAFVGCQENHKLCLSVSSNSTPSHIHELSCLCTKQCVEFGNCCWDYDIGNYDIESLKEVRFTCAKTRRSSGFYVVSFCSSSWTNDFVRLQCEGSTEEMKTSTFHAVPVSSRVTFTTYRNVYCSICNEDTDAKFWTIELKCPEDARAWKQQKNIKGCETMFKSPKFILNGNKLNSSSTTNGHLVKCTANLVNKCPSKWMEETANETMMDIAVKCALIHAPVSMFGMKRGKKFKNEYCAICNGINEVHLLCPEYEARSPSNKVVFPSLSLLLDMDFKSGGLIVGSYERCPKLHLYDPWTQSCRNIMCANDYVLKDDECISSSVKDKISQEHETEYFDTGRSLSVLEGCLLVTFSRDEVSILENGSLVILRDGALRQPQGYETVDNYTINVCMSQEFNDRYVASFSDIQGYITIVGISMSLFSLFIKISISFLTPDVKKLSSKIILFLSLSLFASQSLFLFGISKTEYNAVCTCIGIFMHYGFLSTFFWINALAFDVWKTFSLVTVRVHIRYSRKQLCRYCVYGWITPMIIVFAAVTFNWFIFYPPLNPQYGKTVCWISNRVALLVFFGAPLCILILSNVIFFGVTATNIRNTSLETKIAHENMSDPKEKDLFCLYCKLTFISGTTWLFGFLASFSGNTVLWYFFVIFNSIQGIYILVAFTRFRMSSYFRSNFFSNWKPRHSTTSKSSLTLTASVSRV